MMINFWHDMKWFLKPVGIGLGIGLLLALFGVATGNAQTYAAIKTCQDTTINSYNAVYLTARNRTTADQMKNRNYIGQNAGTYEIQRPFMAFVIPAITTADACSLYLRGTTDNSTTDFEIYMHGARASKSIFTTADFDQFNGWQASGAYNGTILNNTWNSSSYAAWNTLVFNAAGLDSIEAAQGDTLWLALISKEDFSASEPADNEFIIFFDLHDAGLEPYLSLTYDTPPGWSGTIGRTTNPAAVGRVDKANIKSIGR